MQRLWTICIVAILASAPSLAVNVAFPPTTDTYPHNCQVVPYVTFGADGGVVYFIRGDFFTNINTGTEYFAGCEPTGGGMGMQFAPAASGVAVTIHAFLDSDINVSASAGTTTYHVSAGNSIGVSIPGPTSGVGFTAQTPLSAFSVESLSVGSQIANTTPGDIQFDITNTTPADDRRVLLSNLHHSPGTTMPQFPYPLYQGRLAKDAAIPIDLRILYGGVGTSGVPVTLRIIDPPDPSEYIVGTANWQGQPVPGATLSHTGDNVGPPPTFHGNCVPCATYSVTSGANGTITAELDLDPQTRAGDNYQVEATARFPNGTTKTVRSGVITAWKRMFVEKQQMFRSGVPLAGDAPIGVTHIIVPDIDISDTTGDRIGRTDYLVLLHAPSFGQPKVVSSFYQGRYQVNGHPRTFTIPTTGYPAAGIGTVHTFGTTSIEGIQSHFHRQVDVDDVINLPSATGGTEARWVVAVLDNTHLTVNAPTSTNTGTGASVPGLPYTIGDSNLLSGLTYVRLPLDRPLTENYQREPLAARGVVSLNDSVARLTVSQFPPAAADYFDVDDLSTSIPSLLTGTADADQWRHPFPAAYTEYIVLPRQGPLVPLPRTQFPNGDPLSQWFVDKWFSLPRPSVAAPSLMTNCGVAGCGFLAFDYSVPPNHQLVLVGDTRPDGVDLGQTGFSRFGASRQRCTVLDRGEAEYDVANATNFQCTTATASNCTSSIYRLDVDQIMRKVEVHEIAHQWDVDGGSAAHCKTVGYNSLQAYPTPHTPPLTPPAGTLFCTMAVDLHLLMPDPWNSSLSIYQTSHAYGDGNATFHMVLSSGVWSSEYLTIRNTLDPWTP